MLSLEFSRRFQRDYKLALRRGCEPERLEAVVRLLREERPLPEKHRDHALSGGYAGARECHIAPDWLLVYEIVHRRLVLRLLRTGTHSDLF